MTYANDLSPFFSQPVGLLLYPVIVLLYRARREAFQRLKGETLAITPLGVENRVLSISVITRYVKCTGEWERTVGAYTIVL